MPKPTVKTCSVTGGGGAVIATCGCPAKAVVAKRAAAGSWNARWRSERLRRRAMFDIAGNRKGGESKGGTWDGAFGSHTP
ncbi:hypothetical protein GCM10007856_10230 [Azospirillum oryzae]|nr:hypothetical protein GCM10007856_10230 [Azospirillum oryzae]